MYKIPKLHKCNTLPRKSLILYKHHYLFMLTKQIQFWLFIFGIYHLYWHKLIYTVKTCNKRKNNIVSFRSSSHFMLISSRYNIHVARECIFGLGPIEMWWPSSWCIPTYICFIIIISNYHRIFRFKYKNFLFSLYPYAFALLCNQQISRSTTVGTAHTFHMELSNKVNEFNWFDWVQRSPHIIYIINQLLNLA